MKMGVSYWALFIGVLGLIMLLYNVALLFVRGLTLNSVAYCLFFCSVWMLISLVNMQAIRISHLRKQLEAMGRQPLPDYEPIEALKKLVSPMIVAVLWLRYQFWHFLANYQRRRNLKKSIKRYKGD